MTRDEISAKEPTSRRRTYLLKRIRPRISSIILYYINPNVKTLGNENVNVKKGHMKK